MGSRLENLESIRETKLPFDDDNFSLQHDRKSNRLRGVKEASSICQHSVRSSQSEKGQRISEEEVPRLSSLPLNVIPSTASPVGCALGLALYPTLLGASIDPAPEQIVSLTEKEREQRPKLSPALLPLLRNDRSRALHFLIVDDVLMNRRMVRRVLSSCFHAVSEATDGRDCLKVLEEITSAGGTVDVVLMDSSMPIMTGERNQVC